MKKILMAAAIAIGLASAAPLMAQTTNFWTTNTVTAPSPSCMQAAMSAQGQGLIAAYNAYNQAIVAALQIRTNAQAAAWSLTNGMQPETAIAAANAAFSAAYNNASDQLWNAKLQVQQQFTMASMTCRMNSISSSSSSRSCVPVVCPYYLPAGCYRTPRSMQNGCQSDCGTLICNQSSSSNAAACTTAQCGPPPPGVHCLNGSAGTIACKMVNNTCAWQLQCQNASSSAGFCTPADCGPQLGMPNWTCPGGSDVGGLTGRCLRADKGRCSWEVHQCSRSSAAACQILSGSAQGTFTVPMGIPDIGKTYNLTGNGTVTPLGTVQLSGSLHTPGNIASGYATGTITLSNTNGSLVLQLTGPLQTGFLPLPTSFSITIQNGTGQYANYTNMHATGTLTTDTSGTNFANTFQFTLNGSCAQ